MRVLRGGLPFFMFTDNIRGKMRILGIDLGEKNMGIAVTDPLGCIAYGLTVIKRGDIQDDLLRLKEICAGYQVEEIVVGLPLNMNGSAGPAARRAEIFQELLSRELGMKVYLWDERLTTLSAEKVLISADMSRRKRKGVRDKMAAALILESFLAGRQG